MSEEQNYDEIKQIRKPGRANPYITIVDTGLAVAAQSFLAMLEIWMLEGDSLEDVIERRINWRRVSNISDGLGEEIERRTF